MHDLAQPFFCLALPYGYGYRSRLLTNEIETQKLMVVDGSSSMSHLSLDVQIH